MLHWVSEGAEKVKRSALRKAPDRLERGTRPGAKRAPFGFAQGKSRGGLLAMRVSEIEERSLHSVARHANTACKKKPGSSGRDDSIWESRARAGKSGAAPVEMTGLGAARCEKSTLKSQLRSG